MSREPLIFDLESRSQVDLRKTGAHRYAEDPTTQVIVVSYAFGTTGAVRRWWPVRGEKCPSDIVDHVSGDGPLVAHNAEFERVMTREKLTKIGMPEPEYRQWHCTAAMASSMALPRSLDGVGAALHLGVAKDATGHRLMLQMSKPRKIEDDGTVTWWEDADRMNRLADYCDQDVKVTQAIMPHLRGLPPEEREAWLLDALMNDRGIFIDADTVRKARKVVEGGEKSLLAELRLLTSGALTTAKQVARFVEWLKGRGFEIESLARANVEAALARNDLPLDVRRGLEIRLELSKSSTGKLDAMLARRCRDGRARGNLIFHAATTGRWAGTGIQMQNLPRGTVKNPERCLPAIMTGDWRVVEMAWDSPTGAVSSAIRSMITAGPGCDLLVSDFSNIEGRVLAWLAGEAWKLDAFRAYDAGTGPDLYKLTYSKSFGVPVDAVDGDMRQVGKVQELALGYQGGVGAFQTMAAGFGLTVTDERADELKQKWRDAHPRTVAFWYQLEDAAREAIRQPGTVQQAFAFIRFACHGGYLMAQLPSGKRLYYPQPRLVTEKTKFGTVKEVIKFRGEHRLSRKWGVNTTYGGKLAENVTQAVARDLMRDAVLRLENDPALNWRALLTVHDEAVGEVPEGTGDVPAFEKTMSTLPNWAGRLPVSAEGWTGKRYKK